MERLQDLITIDDPAIGRIDMPILGSWQSLLDVSPTDKNGKVMITLTEPTALIAGLGDDIPSAAAPVCLGSQCPVGS